MTRTELHFEKAAGKVFKRTYIDNGPTEGRWVPRYEINSLLSEDGVMLFICGHDAVGVMICRPAAQEEFIAALTISALQGKLSNAVERDA